MVIKERELKEAKDMFEALDNMLMTLKNQETNEQVLDLIDSGAAMISLMKMRSKFTLAHLLPSIYV